MRSDYPSNTGYWSNISTQCWTNIGIVSIQSVIILWPNIGPITDYIGPIFYQYSANMQPILLALSELQ